MININYAQEFNFSPTYTLKLENVEIIDIGVFYSSLISKPVFVDSRLRGKTIANSTYMTDLTRYQVIEYLKKYFVTNGIEIKEHKDYIIFILKE